MEVSVQSSENTKRRCPFCHSDIVPEVEHIIECSNCQTAYHRSCHSELKACLSCFQPFPENENLAQTSRPQVINSKNTGVVAEAQHSTSSQTEFGQSQTLLRHYFGRAQHEFNGGQYAQALKFAYTAAGHQQKLIDSEERQGQNLALVELVDSIFEKLAEQQQVFPVNNGADMAARSDAVSFAFKFSLYTALATIGYFSLLSRSLPTTVLILALSYVFGWLIQFSMLVIARLIIPGFRINEQPEIFYCSLSKSEIEFDKGDNPKKSSYKYFSLITLSQITQQNQ